LRTLVSDNTNKGTEIKIFFTLFPRSEERVDHPTLGGEVGVSQLIAIP
jgi:hypothetical protein